MHHHIENPSEVAGVIARSQPSDTLHITGGTKAKPIVIPAWRVPGAAPFVYVRGGYVVIENGGRVQMSEGELVATNAAVNVFGGTAELLGCSGEVGGRAVIVARHSDLVASGRARVETADDGKMAGRFGAPAHSRIQTRDEAHVLARGSARVEAAGDNVTIEAFDNALVTHPGVDPLKGTITLRDRSQMQLQYGNPSDSFSLRAYDDATVRILTANAQKRTFEISDRAHVEVSRGPAEITLRGEAQALVGAGCLVRAHDRTRVIARGGSGTVVALHDAALCDGDLEVQVRDHRPRGIFTLPIATPK